MLLQGCHCSQFNQQLLASWPVNQLDNGQHLLSVSCTDMAESGHSAGCYWMVQCVYFDVFSLCCALGLHTVLATTELRLEHNLSFVSV